VALRITLAGKGGSGKSTIAGTLCRVLAERGHRVLALDADTVAGLALAVGVDPSEAWPLTEAVRREPTEDGSRRVVITGTPEQVIERCATVGPAGIRFLQYGKPTAPLDDRQRDAATAFLDLVRYFDADGWTVVTDLAAGTRQAYYGWTGAHDRVLLVVRPGASAALTARRLARLAETSAELRLAVVGSGVRSDHDRALVRERAATLGMDLVGMVPYDPAIEAAARHGVAPFDHAPDGAMVTAVRGLADRLTASPNEADGYREEQSNEEPA
jgi:CO dehydrogenase maturation factor